MPTPLSMALTVRGGQFEAATMRAEWPRVGIPLPAVWAHPLAGRVGYRSWRLLRWSIPSFEYELGHIWAIASGSATVPRRP